MNFESRITRASKLPGFDGVSFTLNKMTEGRRIKLRLQVAEKSAKLRELGERARALDDQNGQEALQILEQINSLMVDEIDPVYVRWGLKSIDGLEIDGKPATPELLIEDGPPELYREILAAINEAAGLTERQRGESEPPTTSGAQADGRMSDSSAEPADAPATT